MNKKQKNKKEKDNKKRDNAPYNNPNSHNPDNTSSIVHILNESNSLLKDITSHLPPPSPSRGVLLDIVCSIFEPGVNPGLCKAIHFSFLSLAAVHFWLVYLTGGREWFVWGLVVLNLVLYPCLLLFIDLAYNNKNI